ncbi:MAG: hypothetical protein WBN94_09910 [Methanothrix sp.]
MIPRKPLKDSYIGLRCDEESKKQLEDMAASFDLTVSGLIWRLIAAGTASERARREKIKKILEE